VDPAPCFNVRKWIHNIINKLLLCPIERHTEVVVDNKLEQPLGEDEVDWQGSPLLEAQLLGIELAVLVGHKVSKT
jgi:hypothetical protein